MKNIKKIKNLLGNWTPEFAKENIEYAKNNLEESAGTLLYKLTNINKKIINRLHIDYVYDKQKDFLEKIPKNINEEELLKFKEIYFEKYFYKNSWLNNEAKNTVKTEDLITEKSIIDFIFDKYELNKALKIKKIMEA